MERIGSGHGSLTDQPVDANFSLLLSAEDCVAEDLKDQPGSLGAREEALLVFTPEELVQLVQSEGSRVVVGREVGYSLVHQVGQTQRGQQAGRPVPTGSRLGLRCEVDNTRLIRTLLSTCIGARRFSCIAMLLMTVQGACSLTKWRHCLPWS